MSTKIDLKVIEECVYHAPLTLLTLRDNKVIQEVNSFLPYSVGFEIECGKSSGFNIENFKKIPDIMAVSIDECEQRFRLPEGACGLVCLYNITEQLKVNSELNLGSGIHYHIDLTDCFAKISDNFIEENSEWILAELDKWEYKGTYNARRCSRNRDWVKFSSEHKTIEIRIGEMTFDYGLLVKRIVHCCQIAGRIRRILGVKEIVIVPKKLDYLRVFDYVSKIGISTAKSKQLDAELAALEKNETLPKSLRHISHLIKGRVVDIK